MLIPNEKGISIHKTESEREALSIITHTDAEVGWFLSDHRQQRGRNAGATGASWRGDLPHEHPEIGPALPKKKATSSSSAHRSTAAIRESAKR
jgi:hypothetical protein